MVQLGLAADFNCQVLKQDGTKLPMEEPIGLLGKSYLSKRKIREVVMHTAEPSYTRESTKR